MANFNNLYNPGYSVYPTYSAPQPIMPQPTQMKLEYVTGIQGANAYQMPMGVQQVILWDTDCDSFYIKKLDEMGRPRIVAWKDFHDHVEPESVVNNSPQPDIQSILSNIDFSQFLTKADLDKALSELSVGEKGKVVRNNEFNS